MREPAVSYVPIMHPSWGWRFDQWQGVQREPDTRRIVLPFHHLMRRAEQIAGGALVAGRQRLVGDDVFALYTQYPGHLEVRSALTHYGTMTWAISWAEAGDPDSSGFSSGHTSPDEALAQMIEVCEQHDREQRERMVECTGGLA